MKIKILDIQKPALQVGQKVMAARGVPTPTYYDESGYATRCYEGEVVECLAHGGVSIKFKNYPHTWDYSAKQAAYFERFYTGA